MKAQTVFVQVTLIPHTCGKCGINYAMEESFLAARKGDGKGFYCPNGCSRHYPQGPSEADRLRKMLEEANRSKTQLITDLNNTRAGWEQAEKMLKRTTTRIHAGVCPCCNRTFANLARHMANKHKDAKP